MPVYKEKPLAANNAKHAKLKNMKPYYLSLFFFACFALFAAKNILHKKVVLILHKLTIAIYYSNSHSNFL